MWVTQPLRPGPLVQCSKQKARIRLKDGIQPIVLPFLILQPIFDQTLAFSRSSGQFDNCSKGYFIISYPGSCLTGNSGTGALAFVLSFQIVIAHLISILFLFQSSTFGLELFFTLPHFGGCAASSFNIPIVVSFCFAGQPKHLPFQNGIGFSCVNVIVAGLVVLQTFLTHYGFVAAVVCEYVYDFMGLGKVNATFLHGLVVAV